MHKHTSSPQIFRFNAHRFAVDFSDTLRWMSSLGIKTNSGRLSAYAKAISNWAALPAAQDVFGSHALSSVDQSAILESDKFIDVYRAFHQTSPNDLGGIVDKLTKAIRGPADVADETDKSSGARNFLFEAVVAAKFHCPNHGIQAFLDAPSDTGLTYLSRRIFVECKRLGSPSGIDGNVRKACNQLAIALDRDSTSRHGGLVAVDISNIIPVSEKATDETLLVCQTAKQMDQFIESSSAEWQKVYPEKDLRILGAIFRLSAMVKSESDGLWVISTEWGVNPRLNLGWSETRYMQRLARTLQRVARERNAISGTRPNTLSLRP